MNQQLLQILNSSNLSKSDAVYQVITQLIKIINDLESRIEALENA